MVVVNLLLWSKKFNWAETGIEHLLWNDFGLASEVQVSDGIQ